ncbi:MAG: glycosyltransferase family 4 protein [Deltaproteobacteria bacterium]|nr:glycosyltransferase family 4 protein [Deltaproteobacteria bacterium]
MVHALLIHQAFVGPNEPGGTRHFEFAQRLLEGGDRYTIVASTLSYLSGEKVNSSGGFIQRELNEGVDVIRTYTMKTLHKSFVWRVGSFLSFGFQALYMLAVTVLQIVAKSARNLLHGKHKLTSPSHRRPRPHAANAALSS